MHLADLALYLAARFNTDNKNDDVFIRLTRAIHNQQPTAKNKAQYRYTGIKCPVPVAAMIELLRLINSLTPTRDAVLEAMNEIITLDPQVGTNNMAAP